MSKKTKEKLAILGGHPVRVKKFPAYITMGKEEEQAALRVIRSGVLSKYLGAWHAHFYGGPEVRAFEKEWARYFNVKHAIAVNSCTSGLQAAIGATGIGPGDEVIVSPCTMSASATALLIYGGIPIFADIEEDYFCLDPKEVEKKITSKTKAIIIVDIFGQPYDGKAINALAKKHRLAVIEDTAQAPGALYGKKYTGTLGDIGVFSLNYHKHIHTGEGGLVTTNNDALAERVRLIRNHAESVVGPKGEEDLVNMVGFNFRMTELQAAIGRAQLKKLRSLVDTRVKNCAYIAHALSRLPGITPAPTRPCATHVYYVQPFHFDERIVGVSRDRFLAAVRAELSETMLREGEGPKIGGGYVKPLYLLPLFQKKIAVGRHGFPFSENSSIHYSKGICPVAERLFEKELFLHELMHSGMHRNDLDDVIDAFLKVYRNRDLL